MKTLLRLAALLVAGTALAGGWTLNPINSRLAEPSVTYSPEAVELPLNGQKVTVCLHDFPQDRAVRISFPIGLDARGGVRYQTVDTPFLSSNPACFDFPLGGVEPDPALFGSHTILACYATGLPFPAFRCVEGAYLVIW